MNICTIAYLFISPLCTIFYIKWLNTIGEYEYIAGLIFYPLFYYVFTYIIIKIFKIHYDGKQFDFKLLLSIGLFDSFGSLIRTITTPLLSIIVGASCNRLVIPISMIFGYLLLKKKYTLTHYCGCIAVLFGILYTILSTQHVIVHIDYSVLATHAFSLNFIVMSNIVLEQHLRTHKSSSIIVTSHIICAFQLILGILVYLILIVPFIKNSYTPPLLNYLWNSVQCQFTLTCNNKCSYSLLYMTLFQILGIIENYVQCTILNKKGTVYLTIIDSLRPPMLNVMYYCLSTFGILTFSTTLEFNFTWFNIMGCILIIEGCILYGISDDSNNSEQKNTSESIEV